MTFSDDDLKRLKKVAEKGMVTLMTNPLHVVACAFKPDQLQALLARLEAAENVCEEAGYVQHHADYGEKAEDLIAVLEIWREAAGK